MASQKIVIAGNGLAGARLAARLRELLPAADLTVVGAEPHAAYNRILLSAVLAGDSTREEIALPPAERIEVLTGDPITAIDRAVGAVVTASGRRIAYDTLVLATGSQPISLPLDGASLPGVMSFRDLADVDRMIAASRTSGRAVVIGGGLLGLEAADGLRRRGMQVTVLHLMPWLMERQLDETGGAVLRATLERRGIAFRLGAQTEAFVGTDRVEAVRLKDGHEIPASLVVAAIGIRPNIGLARMASLGCRRGVLVDDALRTSDPGIFAVGECAEHAGRCYGLVAPVWEQVEICARQIAGDRDARYPGSVDVTSLKVGGVALYAAGEITQGEQDEAIVLRDRDRGIYRKLVIRDGRLTGAVLLGDATDGPWYGDLIRNGTSVAALRETLMFGRTEAAPKLAA